MTSWIQLLVQWEAVANQISLTAPVLFAAWIWSMVWSTPVSINTSYTVDIYVPLMENFPFLPVVPLTSSLCSGPLENSAVKLSGSKCQPYDWCVSSSESLCCLLHWRIGGSPWHSPFFCGRTVLIVPGLVSGTLEHLLGIMMSKHHQTR